MLKFDLKETPPTVEQINVERERLAAQIVKRRKIARILLVVLCLIPISLVSLVVLNNEVTPGYVVKYIFGINLNMDLGWTHVGVASVIILAILIDMPGQQLLIFQSQLEALRPLTADDTDRSHKIIALCYKIPLCETYRQAVARQGRIMTICEADMIEKWGEGEAYRQLHSIESICETV